MKPLCRLILMVLVGVSAGCASTVKLPTQTLAVGIDDYNHGRYAEAVKALQNALDQGLGVGDQVRAHKYLAFTHCVNEREKQCRESFAQALRLNPRFELTPAEAGHPLWGPVFRSVRDSK